jgi:RNA polymerase sigma-70 factor (ECF subfamily)
MPAGSPSFESALVAPPAESVEDSDLARAESEKLEQALQALPDHQRVPLVLFHFENQSYQEIAAALGCSIGKIKTDIFRGREALKRVLTSAASRKGQPAA